MNDIGKPPRPSLRQILEAAAADTGRFLKDVTVLSASVDPVEGEGAPRRQLAGAVWPRTDRNRFSPGAPSRRSDRVRRTI
jgi:hypothetical protein